MHEPLRCVPSTAPRTPPATADMDAAHRPSSAVASGGARQPIGIGPEARVVLLHGAAEPCTNRFVAFLRRRAAVLRQLPIGRVRIVGPAVVRGLEATYVRAANKEL